MALEQPLNFLTNLASQLDAEAGALGESAQSARFITWSRGLLRERNTIRDWVAKTSAQRGAAIQLTPDDVDDLPEELLAELSRSDAEQFELDILRIVEEAGGVISLDVLLVQWYRKKNEIVKRKNMTARIYRMLSKERLFSTPGYKGVYQLQRPQDDTPKFEFEDFDLRDETDRLDANEKQENDDSLA